MIKIPHKLVQDKVDWYLWKERVRGPHEQMNGKISFCDENKPFGVSTANKILRSIWTSNPGFESYHKLSGPMFGISGGAYFEDFRATMTIGENYIRESTFDEVMRVKWAYQNIDVEKALDEFQKDENLVCKDGLWYIDE
jgi:hypothetical protein